MSSTTPENGAELRLFGMPSSGITPRRPPREAFLYEISELVPAGSMVLEDSIEPMPHANPPRGYSYPQAQSYGLTRDQGYKLGWAYMASFLLEQKEFIKRRMITVIDPPGILPAWNASTKRFVHEPIPGMVKMIPGVPYMEAIDGDPTNTVTTQCLHTLESLQTYGVLDQVLPLAERLRILTFGSGPGYDGQAIQPVYTLAGLKRNDRSSKAMGPESHVGSYNLSATVGKGEGRGVFMPAVQTSTDVAEKQIGDILQILHKLQAIIMPCCLSKFEWKMVQFLHECNNVFTFGGSTPGTATAVQMNVSVLTEGASLAEMIGKAQGSWHPDVHDYMASWTLFILILRLPPGSAAQFCFARSGLYICEYDVWFLTVAFKGGDVHSGFNPTVDKNTQEEWIESNAFDSVWNMAGPENRVGYVCYPNEVANTRSAALSIFPPLHFGNHGATVAHKDKQRTFAEHGQAILGTEEERAARLAKEAVMQMWNALQGSGLTIDVPINDILGRITYTQSGSSQCLPVAATLPDLNNDSEWQNMEEMKSYFEWYRIQAQTYHIRVSKDEMKAAQAMITAIHISQNNPFSLAEHRKLHLNVADESEGPRQVVKQVLSRQKRDGKVSLNCSSTVNND